MKKKIENVGDLRYEIAQLKIKCDEKEEQLYKSAQKFQEAMHPQNLVMDFISTLAGINLKHSTLVRTGIIIGIITIIQDVFFKSVSNESKIYQLLEKIKSALEKDRF